ncbi:hypothetical protein EV122DRAFT_217083 [Schizophyllum commune]
MDPSMYLDFKIFNDALASQLLRTAVEKGEILKSQAQFVLERNRQHAKPASCLAALLVFVCIKLLLRLNRNSSPLTLADLSPCMRALMLLIVPTRVAWPAHYSRAARVAILSRSSTITLDLHVLLADISSGKIELRHPEDLVDLLSGLGLRVDGWIIALRVDPGWSRKIQRGIAMKPLKSLLTLVDREEAGDSKNPRPGKNEKPTLVLDNVAPSLAQPRLAAFLRAHYACAVEFTTVAGSISAWSTPWILAALPFVAHRHKSDCMRTEPQATPLFATLPGTLELLARVDALGAPDILKGLEGLSSPRKTILAVTNISDNYASDLLELRERLHSDASTRSSYVARYGVECWRERRLMLAWEAALLRAGMLERWSVELRG